MSSRRSAQHLSSSAAAQIDGRPVCVQADDFSVRGGAADAGIWQKLVFAEQMANEYRMPLIRMVDGTGGGGSVKMLEKDPRTYIPQTPGWEWVVANMASVPVVALALGPCAGLGAGRVAASHYSVMVQGLSQVFVAGPPVAKAIGEDVDKEGLGGAEINGKNGVVDDIVASEAEAFAAARKFLSYLPASIHEAGAARAEWRSGRSARCDVDRCRAARSARALQDAPHRRSVRRCGHVLRDRAAMGPRADHRLCAHRWL